MILNAKVPLCCNAIVFCSNFPFITFALLPCFAIVMFVGCNEQVNGQGLSSFLRRLVQSIMLQCHEPKPEPVTPQSQQLQQLQQRWQ